MDEVRKLQIKAKLNAKILILSILNYEQTFRYHVPSSVLILWEYSEIHEHIVNYNISKLLSKILIANKRESTKNQKA